MNKTIKHDIPAFHPLLQRARIKTLLDRAFQNALVTVVAPTGYAKTHEIASYLKDADVRLGWMRVSELDNLPEHFWNHLISALTHEFPDVVKPLKALGFPETVAKMDAWLRIIANDVYKNSKHTVFVIDELGEIESNEVRVLLEYLVKAGLEGFSFVLISRQKTNLDLKALQSGGGVFRITDKHLQFSVEDIENVFTQANIHIPPGEVERIYKKTEGWPLLIYLLSQLLQDNPGSYEESFIESLDVAYSMFESEFFSRYDDNIRQTLVKLSALPGFSTDMIRLAGSTDIPAFKEMLKRNNFVVSSAQFGEYIFQNSYRDFLKTKQEESDIAKMHSIAGDSALSKGQPMHAIEYYSKCRRYDDMLEVMVDYIASRMGINKTQIEYFFEKLTGLPPEAKRKNHLSGYIEACLYIQLLQTEKAMGVLKEMERELLGKPGEKERTMLGEVYERMAGVHMMQAKECFMDYYKKAYGYIPGGSAYKKKSMLRYKNFSIVALQDYGPGAMERMEKAVYDGFDYMNAVENGTSAGFQYLFSAEAAYYRNELKHALDMAHKALYEAENGEAHDIACDALLLLARISLMRGKYPDVVDYVSRLGEYIDQIGIGELKDMKDFAKTWLELSLGSNVTDFAWLKSVDTGITVNAPLVVGRDEFLYAVYLLRKRRHSEMVAYLEQVRPWYMTKGWGDSLVVGIMLAIGYLKLGDEERAIDSLKETYDLTYENKILTPYIEYSSMMRTLIEHIRRSGRDDFDPEWLDDISRKSTTYAKRLSFMTQEYAKHNDNQNTKINFRLTDREMSVIENLAQGLTREEIADELHIKVSTVKSVIGDIYNKMGAVNRVDAIRIAMESGILSQ